MTQEAILSGLKVLEVGHYISAPYAARLLADNGAEVIKIEQPGEGDISRRCGAFPNDIPDPEASSLFLAVNTSKKGITLDITREKGKELFLKMVSKVDAVIEDFPPDFLPSLGLGYDDLSRVNPGLVMTSITYFGQSGPYRHWDATEGVFQAFGGLIAVTGEPTREPLKIGLPMAHYTAGLTGFASTLAALYHAEGTGEGQQVDVALCDAIAANIDQRSFAWALDHPEKPLWGRYGIRRGPLSGLYECQDGFVGTTNVNFAEVRRLADIISPEIDNEEMFGDFFYGNLANSDALEAIVIPWFLEHTKKEVMEMAQKKGMAWGYVANVRDLVEDNPQLREKGSIVELEHPKAGKYVAFAPCNRFSETGFKLSPAPLLGQHNEEIFSNWLGLSKAELSKLTAEGVI